MNPVLILTHNCLELTKKCVESVRDQDIPTEILIWDNCSTDGTVKWLVDSIQNGFRANKIDGLWGHFSDLNKGVSVGWNWGLDHFFGCIDRFSHVLVLNNDTILPPWFYRELLSYDVPFVTGISVDTMDAIKEPLPKQKLVERPDFSAFLIRRDCWEKVGPFNEQLVHYCGDMDYHIRAHRLGIPLMNAGVRFYHERSSTLKHATPEEHKAIQLQADKDRATFRSIYGFGANDPQYEEVFKEKVPDA